MSDDDSKPTRTPAPKTRSLRAPAPVAGVDPPEARDDDDVRDERDEPRPERMLVLNATDGIRPAVRSVPTERDSSGSMQFDRRGSVNLLPGLNFVEVEAWADIEKNLQLRIRAREIKVVDPNDREAFVDAIGMTADRRVLAEILELETKGRNRGRVIESIEKAQKAPERRMMLG